MNETEKLAAVYLEDRKKNKDSLATQALSGTASGASLGFLAPALATNSAPKSFDRFIKNKKPFGKNLSDQLVKDDADKLFWQKVKDRNIKTIDDDTKQQLEKEALEEAKQGIGKNNPLNKNLGAQTGVGRVGAIIGGGLGLANSLINREEEKKQTKKLKKIVGNNKS